MKQVDITLPAIGDKGTVVIDGEDWSSAVSGVHVDGGVDKVTRLTLDLPVRQCLHFTGQADVSVDPRVHDLLLRLGWTPPARPDPPLTGPAPRPSAAAASPQADGG